MVEVTSTKLLSSGYKIPSIALGTYNIPRHITAEVVYNALKIGYRQFDCAYLYGNEREVGQGIYKWLQESEDHKREDVFYTTKIWNSQFGYNRAKSAIDGCLKEVEKLGYIDLVLVHSPLCSPADRLGNWKALQEAVEEGKVRSIGVSSYGIHHLEQLLNWDNLKIKPVVNQIELSPWLMRTEITKFCFEHNIALQAYAPLTQGERLSGELSTDSTLNELCKKYNKTAAQILIRWSLQQGFIPLPKAANPVHLQSNFDVFSFSISDEDVNKLSDPDSYSPTDWECTNAP